MPIANGFAETNINFPDGQVNVSAPPDALMMSGFVPEQAGVRGQPLVAQWLNSLLRTIFRCINRDRISDNTGALLFPYPNSAIQFQAISMDDPTKYVFAIGYKGAASTTHVLRVVNSSGLTLGTATTAGDQPVSGGTNIRSLGISRQIGDL